MRPLDRLLEALRACGRDQYRADPDQIGVWHSYCPGCASHMLDIRRLTIRERNNGEVTMTCSTGCSEDSILVALRVAEILFPFGWSGETPADVEAVADLELERSRAGRRLVDTIRREAV